MRGIARAAALLAVAGALIAGCGSDADDQSATSPGATSTSSATPDGYATSPGPRPSGEPVRVGFVNQDAGVAALPEGRTGALAALRYVNEHLGGVGGRPLELVHCELDSTVEKGVDCANRLAEDRVVAVLQGFDTVSGDAMLPILESAGIPLAGAFSSTPRVTVSPSFTAFGPPNEAYVIGLMKWYGENDVRSATVLLPDMPAMRLLERTTLRPAAERYGVAVRTVWFNPASPDWTVLATTAMQGSPEAIALPAGIDGYCTGLIDALKSAGYEGRIFAAGCSEYRRELGGRAEGVESYANLWQPTDMDSPPAAKRAELEDYAAAMRAGGHEELIPSRALDPFAATVDLARVIGAIDGDVDARSVRTALAQTRDFDAFLGPRISCDRSVWPGRSSCSDSLLVYTTDTDGNARVVSDGWVGLSDGASLIQQD
jgi:branched-chain amino acid transport system substrate-binding protein